MNTTCGGITFVVILEVEIKQDAVVWFREIVKLFLLFNTNRESRLTRSHSG